MTAEVVSTACGAHELDPLLQVGEHVRLRVAPLNGRNDILLVGRTAERIGDEFACAIIALLDLDGRVHHRLNAFQLQGDCGFAAHLLKQRLGLVVHVVGGALLLGSLRHLSFRDVAHAGQREQSGVLLGGNLGAFDVRNLGIQGTTLHGACLDDRKVRSPGDGPVALVGLHREHLRERQQAVHEIETRLSDLGGLARRNDGLIQCHRISLHIREPATMGGFLECFLGNARQAKMPAFLRAVFKAATVSSTGVATFFTPPRALVAAGGRT